MTRLLAEKKRGAKIYAEVIGYGNTSDAYHMTAPHPEAIGAINAIKLCIAEANMQNATDIYINAHGTSTPLNDKTETIAIKEGLLEKAKTTLISSTKSMTGHTLGAAGALEAIASIFALKTGVVPPTIGYVEKDEECDLDYVPNVAREKELELAMSLSLGFGGHNACIAFTKLKGE
jgi:3-oxoacyl-[acyl-carrier-protein] synthase II